MTAESLDAEARNLRLQHLADSVDGAAAKAFSISSFMDELPERAASSAAPTPGVANGITVVVAPKWLSSTREQREIYARTLWQTWARIVSPSYLDGAYITLVDSTGEVVGGSGALGSSIWVK